MTEVMLRYEILLDDSKKDPDYTEGTRPYSNILVFPSFKKVNQELSNLFQIKPEAVSMLKKGSYYHKGCLIEFSGTNDKEIPNKPLCFGFIKILGNEQTVDELAQLLEAKFPEINKYAHKENI